LSDLIKYFFVSLFLPDQDAVLKYGLLIKVIIKILLFMRKNLISLFS